MPIRVPQPPEKYGFLHPASAFGFQTPDGYWWPSVEDWMARNTPPAGKATDAFLREAVITVLRLKFAFNHDIRKKLADTGKTEIRSGKRRHRDHWLGHALMQVRTEIQSGDWVLNVPWTPFSEADFRGEAEAVKKSTQGFVGVFINSRYQVVIAQDQVEGFRGPVDHLSIKRWDKQPVRDWREMQRIKNELCGQDREACELYPSEARLVDTANQYHLWVLPPGLLFPFGYFERLVVDDGHKGVLAPDSKQRPLEERPDDALTPRELDAKILGS